MKRFIVSFVIVTEFLATSAWGHSPFLGSSFPLPEKTGDSNTLEAENYDLGFEDDAFHDSTLNNEGGALRSDSVDIFKGEEDTFYIGSIDPGDWTVYSLRNPIEGLFDIEIRLASAFEEASLIIEFGGIGTVISVPYSGSWDSWRQTTAFNVRIPKGLVTMKLTTRTGNFFIDHIKFIRRPPG